MENGHKWLGITLKTVFLSKIHTHSRDDTIVKIPQPDDNSIEQLENCIHYLLFSKSSTIREIAIHVKHVVGHVIFSEGSFSKWFLDSVYVFGVNGNYHHEENETHIFEIQNETERVRKREKGMIYGRKMTENYKSSLVKSSIRNRMRVYVLCCEICVASRYCH